MQTAVMHVWLALACLLKHNAQSHFCSNRNQAAASSDWYLLTFMQCNTHHSSVCNITLQARKSIAPSNLDAVSVAYDVWVPSIWQADCDVQYAEQVADEACRMSCGKQSPSFGNEIFELCHGIIQPSFASLVLSHNLLELAPLLR